MTEPGPRETPAIFTPERQWGVGRLSAPALLFVLIGVAACSVGRYGFLLGVPLAIVGLALTPKSTRGVYTGKCPHCDAAVSAMMKADTFACVSCGQDILLREDRFVADACQLGHSDLQMQAPDDPARPYV